MKKIALVLAAILVARAPAFAQSIPVYKDSSQPIPKRVNDLLSKMTMEEKFWQLFMIPGDIPPGEEEKYRNGIFGFQVSAVAKKGNAGAQMLDYGVADDPRSLAEKINAIQKYFIERSRLGIPMIAFDEALHGLVRGGAGLFWEFGEVLVEINDLPIFYPPVFLHQYGVGHTFFGISPFRGPDIYPVLIFIIDMHALPHADVKTHAIEPLDILAGIR
jgi:hypothetical protein